jgi:hypothetical protein
MSNEDLAGRVEFTAERVLLGDRAKLAEWGDQRFAAVERVSATHDTDIDVLFVVAHAKDGRTGKGAVLPHLVNTPKDREMRPADLHDACAAALVEANASLAA